MGETFVKDMIVSLKVKLISVKLSYNLDPYFFHLWQENSETLRKTIGLSQADCVVFSYVTGI